MSLSHYYKRAVLLPSGIVILGFVIFSIYDLTIGPGKNYKSEWLTADSMDMYAIGMVILHCIILTILCSTIFLIKLPKVAASTTLSSLSWFILSLTLPFIISLSLTFIKFRNEIK